MLYRDYSTKQSRMRGTRWVNWPAIAAVAIFTVLVALMIAGAFGPITG